MLYRALAKGLLFRFDAETAHRMGTVLLRQRWLWQSLASQMAVHDPALRTELAGMPLGSPVGLAAGPDKNCEMLSSLAALGFGYVTGGTVTLQPRLGNPPPRLRRKSDESLINSMGFPSKGVEFAVNRLRRDRGRMGDTPAVVSVSGVAPEACGDVPSRRGTSLRRRRDQYQLPQHERSPYVSAGTEALTDLLARVNDCRTKPLFVKLPPYPQGRNGDDALRERVLELAGVCDQMGVNALTVANTRPEPDSRLAVGAGGVSGRVLFRDTLRMVKDVRAEVGSRLAINACGGISTAEDAYDALRAGATTVQLYTGMVYRGPTIAREINGGLLKFLRQPASITEAAPTSVPR